MDENKRIKREFIKSAAVMLLALTVLISAVFAWFAVSNTSDISQFALRIETDDGGVYLGDDVAVSRSIVLPCATKFDDPTISSADLAKAVYIETFDIKAAQDVKKAEITVTTEDEDLHYYIVGNYNTDKTPEYLADEIQEFPEDVDLKCTIGFAQTELNGGQYERTVAVIFWAEYNDTTVSAIKNGSLNFNAVVKFTAE